MLALYHVAYAVRNLGQALGEFQAAFGGRATAPTVSEMLLRVPLESPEPRRIRSTSAWIVGQPTPIELWESAEDTPWHVADGLPGPVLHHTAYWADDLDASAVRLAALGFALELTPVHDGAGLLGFAYFRNASGARIELQSSVDKASVDSWIMHGTPKHISWFGQTR